MLFDAFPNAWVLTGPTCSGKTEFALKLADRIGAEIISMDSMALYRGMDVGTAKPTVAQRARLSHHLIDVLDVWEAASVAWWLQQGLECCAEIEARGHIPLFVGGTPLYLKALLYGLFEGPPANLELRERFARESETHGSARLHARLQEIDPQSAQRLHPNDLRRIIRALEVWELTQRPLSEWQHQWISEPDLDPLRSGKQIRVYCLDRPRAELYARINERVDAMLRAGLVQECERLRQLSRPLSREALQAVGYQEVFAHLDGQLSKSDMITRIQTRTRQFAKRQLTWFRRLPQCRMIIGELTICSGELRIE